MSKQPILVILAAGMGSRYGGLKQIDPIGPNGEIVIDYSLYDAYQAGFRRVIFIVKAEILEEFKEVIGNRIEDYFEVQYACQDMNALPKGYVKPEDRVKPWGTSHAVLAAKEYIDAPFCVINADDFYGKEAYSIIYQELIKMMPQAKSVSRIQGQVNEPENNAGNSEKKSAQFDKMEDSELSTINAPLDRKIPHYVMVGYQLMKTLSKNGHVARGICEVDSAGNLINIVERTKIIEQDNLAFFTEDEKTWHQLSEDTTVSMNFWGFDLSLLDFLSDKFPEFLDQTLATNPLKGEYLLPNSVGELVRAKKVKVAVKTSPNQWYGVTYKEDKPYVQKAIAELIAEKKYQTPLWENMHD